MDPNKATTEETNNELKNTTSTPSDELSETALEDVAGGGAAALADPLSIG